MEREGRGPGWVLLGLLPLLGLGVLLAFIVLNGAGVGREDAPPVEDISVGRVALPTEAEFVHHLRRRGARGRHYPGRLGRDFPPLRAHRNLRRGDTRRARASVVPVPP